MRENIVVRAVEITAKKSERSQYYLSQNNIQFFIIFNLEASKFHQKTSVQNNTWNNEVEIVIYLKRNSLKLEMAPDRKFNLTHLLASFSLKRNLA